MTQPMPGFDEDSELVQAARNHSEEAFRLLFLRHHANVFRIAMSITGNEADAAEVAQETFLKVLRHLGQFRGEARFSTWLIRIALNESKLRARRLSAHRWESLDAPIRGEEEVLPRHITGWEEDPEQKYAREEMKGILRQAVDSLPPPYRLAVVLRHLNDLSTEEAAAALGISVPAIKARIFRARRVVREKLAGYFKSTSHRCCAQGAALTGQSPLGCAPS